VKKAAAAPPFNAIGKGFILNGLSAQPHLKVAFVEGAAQAIYDPDHFAVKRFSRADLGWINCGMLELYNETERRLHVSDVLLTRREIFSHELLPIGRKMVLPLTMPFGLVFPPWIARRISLVCPVPDIYTTALRDHLAVATWTTAAQLGPSFKLLTIYKSTAHRLAPPSQQTHQMHAQASRPRSPKSGSVGLQPRSSVWHVPKDPPRLA